MIKVCAFAAALAATSGVVVADDLVYSQPQVPGAPAGISLTEGGNDFGFADRRRADNFTLGLPSDVDFIRFWGGTESDFFGADNISNVESFNIRIFDDNAGVPGSIIFEDNISLAATNPTLTGETVGFLNASMYRFEAPLSATVSLAANTPYWVSVAADVINPVGLNFEGWQWAASDIGDDVLAQRNFDGAGYFVNPNSPRDAAFEFEGVIIPSPGAAGVLALAGLATLRRRR